MEFPFERFVIILLIALLIVQEIKGWGMSKLLAAAFPVDTLALLKIMMGVIVIGEASVEQKAALLKALGIEQPTTPPAATPVPVAPTPTPTPTVTTEGSAS
jgi:hypothetical protein